MGTQDTLNSDTTKRLLYDKKFTSLVSSLQALNRTIPFYGMYLSYDFPTAKRAEIIRCTSLPVVLFLSEIKVLANFFFIE